MAPKLPRWRIRYREARVHAFIAAIILWTGAIIVTFAAPGDRYLTGDLKGADFIQIYTLAHIAFEGDYPRIDDFERFHARQAELVPASAPERYLPVYPPTAALWFAPVKLLSYRSAVGIWAALTILGYAIVVWRTWRRFAEWLPDKAFVAAAAAAFPPFWLLVLFGQTTLVPLLAYFFAWCALRRDRHFAAGLALGLLAIKPQFGIVVGSVVLLTFQWRLMLGAAVSAAAQVAGVVLTMGVQALYAYADTLARMSAVESLLEPFPWRMHSLRTLTHLFPGAAGQVLWLALSVVIIIVTIRVWRRGGPIEARLGVLVLATVLVNPHLFVYDATLLVLPLLWFGAWLERERLDLRAAYWQWVYLLYPLLLIPTAQVIGIQASVLVMAWLFWRVSTTLVRSVSGDPQSKLIAAH